MVRQGIRSSLGGRRLMQISCSLGVVGSGHITNFKREFDKCMTSVIRHDFLWWLRAGTDYPGNQFLSG